jgi:hypothetical protein
MGGKILGVDFALDNFVQFLFGDQSTVKGDRR